ncbi:MAG: PEP-CTERM system TPR-repeat protein PrsT [Gammaproteobacteria bacterium]|nr:PEP-CTERM system TPR-repeat protein PrsT [Gammaproteobacteria bacterium]
MLAGCGAPDQSQAFDAARAALAAGDTRTALIHVHNLLRSDPDHIEGRLLRAEISLAMDDGALAEKDLQRVLDLGVSSDDIVIRLGEAMLLQNAFGHLIADIHTGATNDDSTRARILLLRGDAYLGLERLDSAEQAFRDVADMDPGSPHALAGLGRVAFSRGHPDLALGFLSRARAMAPGDVDILRAYARFHLEAGNLDTAKEAFNEALAARPEGRLGQQNFATLSGLFETHMRLGEVDAAGELAEQALAGSPGHPLAHYLMGEHAVRTGNPLQAAEHLQRTLSALPYHLGALSQLGLLSLEQQRFDLAESYLRQALALDEDNANLRMQLARTLLAQREGDTALEILAPITRDASESPEMQALLGGATRLSHKHSGWLDYFEQAAASDPDNTYWQLELARAYLAAGEPDEGLAVLATIPRSVDIADPLDRLLLEAHRRRGDFQAALAAGVALHKRDPDNSSLELLIGEIHLDAGNQAAARSVMEQVMDSGPADAETLLFAGQVELRSGAHDAAERYFQSAHSLQPDNLKAITSLAVLARRQGNVGQAINIFEGARETNPGSLLPLVGLVSLYLQQDNVQRAYETAQQAVQLHTDDPRALLALGATQMRREEYRDAIATLEDASIHARDAALIHAALAHAFRAADRERDALFSMQRAIRLAPHKIEYAVVAIELSLTLKKYDDAEQLARQVIAANPESAEGHRLLGETLMAQGKFVVAAQAFAAAATADPSEANTIRQFRALARAGSGDAERVLRDRLEAHSGDWRVRQALAGLLHRKGAYVEAIEHYQQILQLAPDNAMVMNNLAVLYKLTDDERALEMAQRAHDHSPHIGNFTDTLGWLLVQNGQTTRGNALLRKAVQQLPTAPEIRYHLAAGLAQSGEVDEARVLLSSLVASEQPFDEITEARSLLEQIGQ